MKQTALTLSDEQQSKAFVKAYLEGSVCLHPTDTIPGLTFDPSNHSAKDRLVKFKKRDENKPFLALVSDLDMALLQWEPLPEEWLKRIDRLWPSSLSIIWKASLRAHRELVSLDGFICIRLPVFDSEYMWLQSSIGSLNHPSPSTSVNFADQLPAKNWSLAAQRVSCEEGFYIPEWSPKSERKASEGSTIISLCEDGRYKIVRKGCVSQSAIDQLL